MINKLLLIVFFITSLGSFEMCYGRSNYRGPSSIMFLDNIKNTPFVKIKKGTFTMGSPEGESKDGDEGQRTVRITKDFEIMPKEVTQFQWFLVTGKNPSYFNRKTDCGKKQYAEYYGVKLCLDHPVENVTWYEVKDFIKRLNASEGKKVYRLPTEAEWEYAARGYSNTYRKFSFGNDASESNNYAWTKENSPNERTHVVGMKKPNSNNLFDLHGNVNEFVEDWYSKILKVTIDPKGTKTGKQKVVKGGSYIFDINNARSAYRGTIAPDESSRGVGFRLVRNYSKEYNQVKRSDFEKLIKPKTFWMGSRRGEPGRRPKVEKRRTFKIQKPFYIMNHEVTQFDWVWAMDKNPSYFKKEEHCDDHMILAGIKLCPTNPVENISWDEVEEFLEVFNEKGAYKYRLPTNQEWEYIARGGKDTTYYFGNDSNDLENHAWFISNSGSQTRSVMQKSPNAYGLYDVYGNVSEWTQSTILDLLIGPDEQDYRVIRGGSYKDNKFLLRSAAHEAMNLPNYSGNFLGLRLVQEVVKKKKN